MSGENWTPGPWTYTEDDRNGQPQVEDGSQLICLVAHECVKPDHETEANAHLIATSPSLYDQLKAAVEIIDEEFGEDAKTTVMKQELARARGEDLCQ